MHEVSLLTINPALQVNAALVVDRLMGLRSADDFISTPVEAAQEPGRAQPGMFGASSYTDSAGSVWQVLQLHQLVQSPQFLSIRV